MGNIKKLIKDCKEELNRRGLKRVGYCSKCGDCCRSGHGMWFNLNDIYDFGVDKRYKYCSALDKETNLCTIHKNKRWICKCWPMLPEHIEKFPNCTYKFVKK